MSSRKTINLLAVLCCGLMLQLDLSEVSAQVPPTLPPPTVGGAGAGGSGLGGGRGRGGIRGAEASTEPKAAKKGKFEELLENKDLTRFRGYAQPEIGAGWKMQGKTVHFDGSGGGDIITVDEYDNFELQFDWKISEGGNSGVMYRVSLGDNAPYFTGPEYQVLDDDGHADGKKASTSAGSLYAMYEPQNKKARKAGTWNSTKIIVDGNKITHYLNGVKVVEAEMGSEDWNTKLEASKFKDWEKFAKNRSGHIAFQDHGNEVWYRKIRVKRLASSNGAAASSRPERPAAGRGGPPPNVGNRGGRGGQQRGGQRGGNRLKPADADAGGQQQQGGAGTLPPTPPPGGLGGPPPGVGNRGGRGGRGGGE